jgi:hypothetical protein
MYKRFREMLVDIGEKGVEEQLTIIDRNFNEWKKSQDQMDDILVIGIRIN